MSAAPGPRNRVDALFAGGGRMGEVMASWDWSATPVGRPEGWPAPLRQVVRILLTSRFAMWMAWGPELMLSARAGEEAAIEGLTAGADDYLVKPFSSHDLLARIRSNLELARLRNREGAWRAGLLNALQDALVVVDSAGRVVEINDAFPDVLGYGEEGLPYSPPYPWWPDPATEPQEFALGAEALAEAQRSGGRFLLPQRHRNGHRLWIEASASTVHDPGGKGPMIVGVFRDVTDQHRAALRDRLLAGTGELLSRSAPLQDRLERLTALAAPVLADTALVSLVRPDGRLRATAAASSTTPQAAAALQRSILVVIFHLLADPPLSSPTSARTSTPAGSTSPAASTT